MRRLLTVLLAAIVSTTVVLAEGGTGATSLVGAEYFYDTDPGYGQATSINNVTVGDNILTLSVDGLSPGVHMLCVRSLESSGLWSTTVSTPILLTPQRADNVVRVEYFFDTDPGYGHGSSVSAANGENALPLNISGMSMGIHHLNLRSQDAAGIWSTTLSQSLFITSPKTADLTRVEYFFDTDPGYGLATPISGSLAADATYALPLDGLAIGSHLLCVRAQDNHGRWSSVVTTPLFVTGHPANAVAAEYFLDANDPGVGQATPVALPADLSQPIVIAASTEGLDPGDHTITVRVLNDLGFWTTIVAGTTFTVNAPAVAEAYAVLTDNGDVITVDNNETTGKTLTFYYDDKKATRGGMSIGPFSMEYDSEYNRIVNSEWFSQRKYITNVVFDNTFANHTTLEFTNGWFVGCSNLTSIVGIQNLKTDNVKSMDEMFSGCTSLTSLDVSGFNTANVWGMRGLFKDCSSLTNLDVSNFNTTKVTSMGEMFSGCSSLTSLDLSNFNTENVTEMIQMFFGCSGLTSLDVSNFNTEKVTDLWAMFSGCSSLTSLDVSNFNTANVTDMGSMFSGCSSLTNLDLSNFNTEKVTDLVAMFDGCSGLTILDVTNFNTANVTNMGGMFWGCSGLTSLDVTNFNTGIVTDMGGMFWGCSGLTSLDVSNFNTENITNMSGMFYGCSGLTNLDVSNFNTANVTDMSYMFYGCSGLTSLDVSNFNTGNVTYMGGMFSGCSGLTTIYAGDGWSTEKVTDSADMFNGCTALVGGMGTVYDANHVDAAYAHIDGGTANPGYLTDKHAAFAYAVLSEGGTVVTFYYDDKKAERGGIDINNDYVNDDATSPYGTATTAVFDASFDAYRPTSTAYWFMKCESLTAITGIEYLHTDNVTDMSNMFYGCSGLTSLDVSNFNTVNVADMDMLFYHCSNLTVLDVTNFNTGNVINMDGMFRYCSNLTSLDVTNFNTEKVWNMDYMFGGCSNLTSLDVSNFNTANVSTMFGMFDGCSGLTSLNVSNFNTANVTRMMAMFENCSGLTSLNVTNFNTENVTTMRGMFHGCSGLNSLDVTYFNTTNVTDMCDMFAWCSGLTSLDLTNFNTANVTDMNVMFTNCSNLKTIYAGDGWSTEKVTESDDMFTNSTALVGGMGTVYDANHVDAAYAHIDGGTANPGYFTDKNAVPAIAEAYAVLSADSLTVTFYYDNKKAERGGIDINNTSGAPSPYGTATTAVFDASFDTYRPTSTAYWFYRCSSLATITGIEYLHTDDVTTMYFMFSDCTGLTTLDLSHFNTANVTEMTHMFHACSGLTSLDVSGLNTANVTDMDGMFGYCSSLTSLDLTNFNTANVTRMWGMFEGCSSLTSLDLTNFNTANVTDMTWMFYNCSGLTSLDVSNFNTVNVKNMGGMFISCSGLTSLDLTNFNTGNVLFMDRMFRDCSALTTIYAGEGWSTEKLNESYDMFTGCTALVGGMGTVYDADHVDAAYAHIDGGASNPGYLTNKNAVPAMTEAYAVLSSDGTVVTFYYDNKKAVRGGIGINKNWIDGDKASPYGTATTAVFDESFDTYRPTDAAFWFMNCSSLTTITGIEYLHTDDVLYMGYMFFGCSGLTSLDVSGFNTGNVTSMDGMFSRCSSLTSLDVHGFNTGNVTDMNGMFYGCSGLTSLDLSNFNTAKVTNMWAMFYGCSGLTSLDVSGFNTANVTDMSGIFNGCSSLASIQAGGAAFPTEEYEMVKNPNLLVYVNDTPLAPAGVQNVVIAGLAKEIVLTDATTDGNYNFYVPEEFTAEKISYSRNFQQQTTPGVSRGWETLVLPFAVQNITHETNGELKPYKTQPGDKTFWLRTLTATGIKSAARIVANMPYLISMPNNHEVYDDEYCQGGVVTFASANVTVPQTKLTVAALSDNSIVMRPTMLRLPQSTSIYALNVGEPRGSYQEGSVFESDLRGIRPFECYTQHNSGTGGSRFITLGDMNGGDATGIQTIDDVQTAEQPTYNMAGQMVNDGKTNRKLPAGVYIQHGRKFVK